MKILLQIALFVFSNLVYFSGNSYADSGWSGDATVTGIFTLGENRAIIKLSNFTNPNSCLTTEGGDVYIDPTAQKTWFAVFLSAYMANKTVNIFVAANCIPVWANTSFAEVVHVRLR